MATSITITLPYTLAALATGTQPVSKIDDDLTAITAAVSGIALAAGDITAGSGISVTTASAKPTIAATIGRSYLAGLTLSNDGASPNTVLDIAVGQVMDSTNVILMVLSSAYTKTTGAWAVGTGNGGLDTGSVAANTWYHVFLIRRSDTGVVDILFSTSATAPTMPTNYDAKRRIGSFKTATGTTNILTFTQSGIRFDWLATVLDVNAVTPTSTAAVTRTLTVPTGVKVRARVRVGVFGTAVNNPVVLSDLAVNDEAADVTNNAQATSVNVGGGIQTFGGAEVVVTTNTSGQIRSRLGSADATATLSIRTIGWDDYTLGLP